MNPLYKGTIVRGLPSNPFLNGADDFAPTHSMPEPIILLNNPISTPDILRMSLVCHQKYVSSLV